MALDGTYAGLKASVASWLKRSDLTDSIPDLIELGEARIARDLRLRAQITFGALPTVASQAYVSLPADYLEAESIALDADLNRPLSYVTSEQMDYLYPSGSGNGVSAVYTVTGDRLYLAPIPDGVYTVNLTYYSRFTALSADADTNWLLTKHPSIYLFATLAEAEPFTMNDGRVAMWEAKYAADKKALEDAEEKSSHSGSVLRVRTTV